MTVEPSGTNRLIDSLRSAKIVFKQQCAFLIDIVQEVETRRWLLLGHRRSSCGVQATRVGERVLLTDTKGTVEYERVSQVEGAQTTASSFQSAEPFLSEYVVEKVLECCGLEGMTRSGTWRLDVCTTGGRAWRGARSFNYIGVTKLDCFLKNSGGHTFCLFGIKITCLFFVLFFTSRIYNIFYTSCP